MSEEINNLAYLFLGWLFGLLGSLAFYQVQRAQAKRDFMASALGELSATKLKLAITALQLQMHLGPVEDEFINWVGPIIKGYDGPDKDPKSEEEFANLANMSREQRRALFEHGKTPGKGPRPIQCNLPFLRGQISSLALCPRDFQLRIIQILEHLDFFNQDAQFVAGQLDMTFDRSLAGQNRERVEANVRDGYLKLARRARWAVDSVTSLEARY